MFDPIKQLMDVAFAEEGYLEKSRSAYAANPNIIYEKTAGAGYDNYTKYGKEMHDLYPQVMDFPAPWCNDYCDWCFNKAYGTTTAKSLLGGNFDDYTVASASMYAKKNALFVVPQRGDQVFFTKNGQISGCYHTGIVYYVDQLRFYTIEGNTSAGTSVVDNGGGVFRKSYLISYYRGKTLFGRPNYSIVKEPESVKTESKKEEKELTLDDLKFRELKSNMVNRYVELWQYIIGSEVTGVFDLTTEKDTKKWKKEHGLEGNPYVKDKAWKKGIESLKLDKHKLEKGSTGKHVKIWQMLIGERPTGNFTDAMKVATVKWKKKHGLDDKPVVGMKAWIIALDNLKK